MAYLDALFNQKQYLGSDSLADLCFRLICANLDIISFKDKNGYRTLRCGLAFPSEICDKIIEFAQKNGTCDVDDRFLSIFKSQGTRLKRVKIVNCSLTDESVLVIAKHKVTDLELTECSKLTDLSIEHINAHSENLTSLAFRGTSTVVPQRRKFGKNFP